MLEAATDVTVSLRQKVTNEGILAISLLSPFLHSSVSQSGTNPTLGLPALTVQSPESHLLDESRSTS